LISDVPRLLGLAAAPAAAALIVRGASRAHQPAFRRAVVVGSAMLLVYLTAACLATPDTTEFFYGGALLTTAAPFEDVAGIPIATSPHADEVYDTLVNGDVAEFEISCWRHGDFDGEPVDWARIVGGDYQGLWVPTGYLHPLAPGKARSLPSCTGWRWRLFGWLAA